MLAAAVVVLCSLLSATTCAAQVEMDPSHPSIAHHDAWASNRLRHGNGEVWSDDDTDKPTKTGREESDEWRFGDKEDPKVADNRPIVPIDDVTDNDGDRVQLEEALAQQPSNSLPSKRRHHIFVGKKSVGILAHRYQPEVESVDSLSDDSEAAEAQEKRGRMFVGKRWPMPSFDADNQSEENVAAFEKLLLQPSSSGRISSTSQKRVRMFVGKKKAPFFVGRR